MSEKTYTIVRLATTILVAIAVGVSVTYDNLLIPLVAVLAGIAVMVFSRRHVNFVLVDERVYRISEIASRRAMTIFGLAAAFLTPILVIVGQQSYPTLSIVGTTLGLGAAAMMLIYYIFYVYYSRIAD